MANRRKKVETVTDFIFLGSKITVDGDCSHEIKHHLLLERRAMTNLDSLLKSRDTTLPTKICIIKAMVFPVVVWRRLLRVPWTATRSNQSILKGINLGQKIHDQWSAWTSLMAQTIKCLELTVWETWVQSLGREDLLEKEMATHPSILAWKIPWTESLPG